MHIELTDAGDPAHRDAILAPLAAHNTLMTGRADKAVNLGIFLRDDAGAVTGGMFGVLWGDWFKLEFFFLPAPRRGQRLGARMLSALELAAVAHGAKGMWMQSFSLQAPGFYQKQGYHVVGVLPDRPPGHKDVFLAKTAGFGREGADFEVTEAPVEADKEAVRAHLRKFTDDFTVPSNARNLSLLVRDDAGAILGGMWGNSSRQWLYIDLLGLPPALRGSGMGTRLMGMAEAEARRRGCVAIWLDTFSFQARPFYEKLGFHVFAQIPDYPEGHTRFFLTKRIDAA